MCDSLPAGRPLSGGTPNMGTAVLVQQRTGGSAVDAQDPIPCLGCTARRLRLGHGTHGPTLGAPSLCAEH